MFDNCFCHCSLAWNLHMGLGFKDIFMIELQLNLRTIISEAKKLRFSTWFYKLLSYWHAPAAAFTILVAFFLITLLSALTCGNYFCMHWYAVHSRYMVPWRLCSLQQKPEEVARGMECVFMCQASSPTATRISTCCPLESPTYVIRCTFIGCCLHFFCITAGPLKGFDCSWPKQWTLVFTKHGSCCIINQYSSVYIKNPFFSCGKWSVTMLNIQDSHTQYNAEVSHLWQSYKIGDFQRCSLTHP